MIFTWTPPHFWALALAIKDEYQKVNIPMLPVVHGERRTQIEIVIYTLALLPLTLLPFFYREETGKFYAVSAVLLWCFYIQQTWVHLKTESKSSYKRLFYFSILYLFLLFVALGIDGALRYFGGKV